VSVDCVGELTDQQLFLWDEVSGSDLGLVQRVTAVTGAFPRRMIGDAVCTRYQAVSGGAASAIEEEPKCEICLSFCVFVFSLICDDMRLLR